MTLKDLIRGPGPFFFGIVTMLVGAGVAYLMLAFPEGRNAQWPLGMALLIPAAMAIGGLHMIGTGLGFPRFSIAMLRILPYCVLGVANWGVFFTAGGVCTAALSFFGAEIIRWHPSEEACRNAARFVVLCFDALFLVPLFALAWNK